MVLNDGGCGMVMKGKVVLVIWRGLSCAIMLAM